MYGPNKIEPEELAYARKCLNRVFPAGYMFKDVKKYYLDTVGYNADTRLTPVNADRPEFIAVIRAAHIVFRHSVIPGKFKSECSPGCTETFALQLHSGVALLHAGNNRFRITHSLLSMLSLTNAEPGDPMLPFEAFGVELPDGRLVEFSQVIDADGEQKIRVLVIGRDREGFTFSSTWGDELTAGAQETTKAANYMRHIIKGLCSFLAAGVEPLEVENAKAVRRANAKGEVRPRVFVVGKTVKISKELREYAARNAAEPLWKLEHRYVVRGHWRNQVCGPMRAERRKTWIQPYWKGPEGAEAWQHVYEIAEPVDPAR